MNKTNKNSNVTKTANSRAIAHRINSLVTGRSTVLPNLGVVKCTQSARSSKDHKRKFSVSKSKVAVNRGGYTLSDLMDAFGLRG